MSERNPFDDALLGANATRDTAVAKVRDLDVAYQARGLRDIPITEMVALNRERDEAIGDLIAADLIYREAAFNWDRHHRSANAKSPA